MIIEDDPGSMDRAFDEPVVEQLEQESSASVDSGVSVVDDSESHDETVSNVGEQNEAAIDSDFEHNFNHYFSSDGAALQIEKEDHFVVVDNDEVGGIKALNKVDVEHGDEWLLI